MKRALLWMILSALLFCGTAHAGILKASPDAAPEIPPFVTPGGDQAQPGTSTGGENTNTTAAAPNPTASETASTDGSTPGSARGGSKAGLFLIIAVLVLAATGAGLFLWSRKNAAP